MTEIPADHKERQAKMKTGMEPQWIRNATDNRAWFERYQRENRNVDMDTELKGILKDKIAVIVGSGPSLDTYGELLPYLQKNGAFIMCGASNAAAVKYYMEGKSPDVISAFDSSPVVSSQLASCSFSKTPFLLVRPITHPSVLKHWHTLYGRKVAWQHPINNQSQFLTNVLPYMYPEIKIGAMSMGCTPNNLLSLATYMGAKRVLLLGVDFAFKDIRENESPVTTYRGASRKEWRNGKQLSWSSESGILCTKQEQLAGNFRGKELIFMDGVATTKEMLEYKLAFMMLQMMDKMPVTRIGTMEDATLLNNIPMSSPDAAEIMTRCNDETDLVNTNAREAAQRRALKYLQKQGYTIGEGGALSWTDPNAKKARRWWQRK